MTFCWFLFLSICYNMCILRCRECQTDPMWFGWELKVPGFQRLPTFIWSADWFKSNFKSNVKVFLKATARLLNVEHKSEGPESSTLLLSISLYWQSFFLWYPKDTRPPIFCTKFGDPQISYLAPQPQFF